MVDGWVSIKIKSSTKEKLDNAIRIIKEDVEFREIPLSYNYIINRMYNRWIDL